MFINGEGGRMNHRDYMRRIEEKIGEIKAADGIKEGPWLDTVMTGLSEISKDCAVELQKETGGVWNKHTYVQGFQDAPPTRLLALEIVLASWLGWIMREKQKGDDQPLSATDCWRRIEEAYLFGVELSRKRKRPEEID